MEIILRNRTIDILFTDNELSSSQKNQIKYYEFSKIPDKNIFRYTGEDEIIKANKIISYLNKHSLNFKLSNNLKNILDEAELEQKQFTEVKNEALKFKKGIINKKKFNDFCLFVNNNIKRKLKNHQIKAAFHHYLLKNAANFSVPGSGKTSTLITVYERLRKEGEIDSMFVVGPLSSFTAWKNEYEQTLGRNANICILSNYSKQERTNLYYEANTDTDLFLITFQTFANDYKLINNLFVNNKILFIIDEAHYIKQIGGKWASAIINNSKNAKARYILTGTPCPKSYTDLFNLFDILWGDNIAINEQEKVRISFCEKNDDIIGAQEILSNKIDPLFYRVRKNDLGLTEPNFHDPIIITMSQIERKIYDSIFNKISELSHFDSDKNIMALLNIKRGRIIRLRQSLSYIKLLMTAIDDYNEDLLDDMDDIRNIIFNYDKYEKPEKLFRLLELINNIQIKDRKIVIWTNFIKTISLIEKYLISNNISCSHITGSTPTIEKKSNIMTREKIINEFLKENSNIDVLIANPAACAESISLHKTCHHAIYYDLSYNCAQYLQSLDRIHRVGGSETQYANYYFLQYKDSIDNDILNNLLLKRNKMYAILEQNSDIYNLDITPFTDIDEENKAYDRIFAK